ncbi:MAG: hypothetical protein K6E95_00745 [Lachnospiraceae bacterium]|nr:hypothetical protein [Lachnospiraceae bacterium]
MAFCKYCGAQIPEGGVCNCPQAQAEAAGNVSQPAPAVQPAPVAPQPAPAAPQPAPVGQQPVPAVQPVPMYQPYPGNPAGNGFFGKAFAQFGSFFTKPVSLITDSVEGKIPFEATLVLGGLYAVVVWIMLMIVGFVSGAGPMSIIWSLLAAIVVCGFRVGIAALISVFAKGAGITFKKSLAVCLTTSIPATICWFLYGTLGLAAGFLSGFFFAAALLISLVYYVMFISTYVKDANKVFLFAIIIAGVLVIANLAMGGYGSFIAGRAAARSLSSYGDLLKSLF